MMRRRDFIWRLLAAPAVWLGWKAKPTVAPAAPCKFYADWRVASPPNITKFVIPTIYWHPTPYVFTVTEPPDPCPKSASTARF